MRMSGESTWVLRPELMGRCDICGNHEREVVIKNAMTATKSLQEGQTCPSGSYSDWVTLILGSKYFLTNKALLWWLCSFIVLFCKFPDLSWILLLKYTLSGTKRIKLCNRFIQIICSKVSYSICIYCKVVPIKLLNKKWALRGRQSSLSLDTCMQPQLSIEQLPYKSLSIFGILIIYIIKAAEFLKALHFDIYIFCVILQETLLLNRTVIYMCTG